jgi:hypothetical protein
MKRRQRRAMSRLRAEVMQLTEQDAWFRKRLQDLSIPSGKSRSLVTANAAPMPSPLSRQRSAFPQPRRSSPIPKMDPGFWATGGAATAHTASGVPAGPWGSHSAVLQSCNRNNKDDIMSRREIIRLNDDEEDVMEPSRFQVSRGGAPTSTAAAATSMTTTTGMRSSPRRHGGFSRGGDRRVRDVCVLDG